MSLIADWILQKKIDKHEEKEIETDSKQKETYKSNTVIRKIHIYVYIHSCINLTCIQLKFEK